MKKEYPKFKAAAVQAAPVYLNLEATVDKVCLIIGEAASNGAKLVAFPESYIPGYPWWCWLMDSTSGGVLYHELYENAVQIPSQAVKKISEAAKRNSVYVCVSVNEKDGGSLYLTQLWFDPVGNLMGKHRKMKPSGGERLIWGDGEGSMMPCFDTELGRLGGLQCWEHWIPLNVQAMNGQNEQVHVASWPAFFPGDEVLVSTPPNEVSARYYALATQTYVVMATQIHTDEILNKITGATGQGGAYKGLVDYGGGDACIIGPNGRILTEKLPPNQEGIVYADIDLEKLVDCKYQIDPAGHYSNKSLTMNFNRRPQPVVNFFGGDSTDFIPYEDMQKVEE